MQHTDLRISLLVGTIIITCNQPCKDFIASDTFDFTVGGRSNEKYEIELGELYSTNNQNTNFI